MCRRWCVLRTLRSLIRSLASSQELAPVIMKQNKTQLKSKPKPRKRLVGLKTTNARTPGTIIRALFQPSKPRVSGNSKISHYLACRTDPFHSSGGAAIPDGQNKAFVVTDTFCINNISPSAAGQTIVIQTLNCLPALAMIGSTSNFTVDGQLVTALSSLTPTSTASTTWYPACIPPPYSGLGAPASAFADPYNATAARLVSLGFRLIYTGPATTCAGVITVTPNPVAWSDAGVTVSALLGAAPVSAAGVLGTAWATGSSILTGDFVINPNTMTRETQTFRPEQGVRVLASHTSDVFKRNPTVINPYVALGPYNDATSTGTFPNLFRQNPTTAPGIIWYDNDWMGYQIVISGVNSDATFRLESVCCMEYNPAISSPFYPLSVKQSPSAPPGQLNQAEKSVTNTSPAAGS